MKQRYNSLRFSIFGIIIFKMRKRHSRLPFTNLNRFIYLFFTISGVSLLRINFITKRRRVLIKRLIGLFEYPLRRDKRNESLKKVRTIRWFEKGKTITIDLK